MDWKNSTADSFPGRDETRLGQLEQRLQNLSPEQRASLLRRLGKQVLTGNDLVVEALWDCGVERLSGIMGTPVDAIYGAAFRKGLRVVGCRQQTNAVLAASVDNYASGKLKHVVTVSAGPAITNAITGVYYTRDNHFPMLLLGGQRSPVNRGCGDFQELDGTEVMQTFTKWAATVPDACSIAPMIRKAVEVAISGQPGPVYLGLPEDVLEQSAVYEFQQKPERTESFFPEDTISKVLKILRQASSPLLCLGEDLRWDTDLDALLQFIEREQIPFVTTPMARGLLPETHPLCGNTARRRMQLSSDCLVLVRAWFDWRFRYGAELNTDANVVHIHPSAEHLGKNMAGAFTVSGSAGAFLNQLTIASNNAPPVTGRRGWIEQMELEKKQAVELRSQWRSQSSEPMQPRKFYESMQMCIPVDSILSVDGNISLAHAQHSLFPRRPFSWFDPGRNGLIGSSLGAAMGLKLAHPDRPVFALMSDTSFGLSGMELETCSRNGIHLIVVLANNSGNTGSCRDDKYFPESEARISRFSQEIAYHDIASALGWKAWEIRHPEEIGPALEKALAANEPCLLNAIFSPDALSPGVW